jgi:hypothetical protein
MKKYYLSLVWVLLLFGGAPALMAQNTPAATKEQNIRKLLVLTDARGIFKRSIEMQIDMVKATSRDVPARFWDEVLKEVDPDKFVELIIPVYDKHFSNEELESLIIFYQTPLGKKLLAELPQVMTESAAVGEKYGQEVANRVVKRMQADGTFPSAAPTGDGKPLPPLR